MVPIDKGVPLPKKSAGARKYPWQDMVPGDSFFISGDDDAYKLASSQVANWTRASRKYRFTQRNVEGGVRVWCVDKDEAEVE